MTDDEGRLTLAEVAAIRDALPKYAVSEYLVMHKDGEWRAPKARTSSKVPGYDLGLGLLLPLTAKAEITRKGWGFDAVITIVNSVDGAIVVSLSILSHDGHSVSAADLREVAVDQLVYFAQMYYLANLKGDEEWWADPGSLSVDDKMRRVATAYRLGLLLRQNATETVATNLKVSRATAGRLVRQARDRGFLGESIGTKAGET